MKLLFLSILLFINYSFAQSKNPDEIIDQVVKNFNRVKDYQVDVNIKVDVEFLKVPESKAKIYFKQPNKVHLESEGFAMLPKEGLDFSPSYLAKKDYTAIYEKDDLLDGGKTSIVKIIPTGDKGNVVLTSLWIDQKEKEIRKVESTTKTNGTFTINLSYDNKLNYPLPSKIVFAFNIDQMNLPKSFDSGDEDSQPRKKSRRTSSITKGQVIITYSNYQINKGVPDSIFEEKKESEKK
jgi:outer membrane lipoprotein-sorting protein